MQTASLGKIQNINTKYKSTWGGWNQGSPTDTKSLESFWPIFNFGFVSYFLIIDPKVPLLDPAPFLYVLAPVRKIPSFVFRQHQADKIASHCTACHGRGLCRLTPEMFFTNFNTCKRGRLTFLGTKGPQGFHLSLYMYIIGIFLYTYKDIPNNV